MEDHQNEGELAQTQIVLLLTISLVTMGWSPPSAVRRARALAPAVEEAVNQAIVDDVRARAADAAAAEVRPTFLTKPSAEPRNMPFGHRMAPPPAPPAPEEG